MSYPDPPPPPRRGWIYALLLLTGLLGAGAWYMLTQKTTPEMHLARAETLLDQKEFRTATIELRNAIKKQPRNQEARWLLSQTLLSMGLGADAENELERLQRLGFSHSEFKVSIARAQLLQGQFEHALALSNADNSAASSVSWMVARGEAFLGLERAERARKEFEAALAIEPANSSASRGLVRVEIMEGRIADASQEIGRVVAIDPTSVDAWLMKGELDLVQEKFPEARAAFRKALDIDPRMISGRVGVIRSFLAEKNQSEANAQIELLRQAVPEHPVLTYLQALAAHQRGDLASARSYLRAVLSQNPSHGPSLLLLGQIEYATGNLADAAGHLEQHLALQPWHTLSRKMLAGTYLQLGQPEKAVAALAPALSAGNADAEILSVLGTAYMHTGNREQGLEMLDRALAISPNDVRLRTQAALGILSDSQDTTGLSELEAITQETPEYEVAAMSLVMTYLRNGDLDKALNAAQAYTKNHDKSTQSWAVLGIVQSRRDAIDEARGSFKRAIELGDDNFLAHLNLARLELMQNNLEMAEAYYKDIVDAAAGNPGALSGLAAIAFAAGNQEQALARLEQSRQANPGALSPRLLLGDFYMRMGKPDLALQVAREAEAIAPNNEAQAWLLARALLGYTAAETAAQEIADLSTQFPDSARLHYLLATSLARLERLDDARGELQKAIALQPDFALAHAGIAGIDMKQGRFEQALALADELIASNAALPTGWQLRGEAHAAAGEYDKALVAYRKALELAPTGTNVLRLYEVQVRKQQPQAARETLDQWLAEQPDDVQVLLVRAWLHSQDGEFDTAMDIYRHVLTLVPDNSHAAISLAWIYFNRADNVQAVALARAAHERDPDNMNVADALGWILVNAGQAEQGLPLLEQAFREAPENDSRRYRRAYAFATSGRSDDALQELEQLVLSGRSFPERDAARALLKDLR